MTKIDLITGFLGAGKTTFIRNYVSYLLSMGQRVCILENDYGAVNVDTMLLSDMISDKLDIESVAGGCDADCHKRRFKTKLITMGMKGYDRVIVEPSGLFDVDEFFDTLYEEPLDFWYEIGSVMCLIEANLDIPLSEAAEKCIASEIANSGMVVFTKKDLVDRQNLDAVSSYINDVLKKNRVNRDVTSFSLCVSNEELSGEEIKKIMNASYKRNDYIKFNVDESGFNSCYFMDTRITLQELKQSINNLFNDSECGNIFRVKGFVYENGWHEINATKSELKIDEIKDGQRVIIVIGENLKEEKISKIIY